MWFHTDRSLVHNQRVYFRHVETAFIKGSQTWNRLKSWKQLPYSHILTSKGVYTLSPPLWAHTHPRNAKRSNWVDFSSTETDTLEIPKQIYPASLQSSPWWSRSNTHLVCNFAALDPRLILCCPSLSHWWWLTEEKQRQKDVAVLFPASLLFV